MVQKSVFISYRRNTSKHLARSIYMKLKANNWDTFFDVNSIDNGDFDRIILRQIGARAHFILLISPDSLKRCVNSDDWVLREIVEAVRLNRNIVPMYDENVNLSTEFGYLPKTLYEIVSKKNVIKIPHDFFDESITRLENRFLKAPEYDIEIIDVLESDGQDIARHQKLIHKEINVHSKLSSLELMQPTFEWITIPSGEVKLRGFHDTYYIGSQGARKVYVDKFEIAKYPITNEQFRKFLEADGYERKWDIGQYEKLSNKWTQPELWEDKIFSKKNYPVVGVSWYEAYAFTQWLSEITGENIVLPSNAQWQRAAQGNTDRKFPWGDKFKHKFANCGLKPLFTKPIGRTTAVTKYEGIGDSPYKVVDMSGNVYEWTATDYLTGQQITRKTTTCIVHGGSWTSDTFYLWVYHPFARYTEARLKVQGFRIARMSTLAIR